MGLARLSLGRNPDAAGNCGVVLCSGVFDMKLPDMSVIDTHLPSNTKIRGYTVEQMLAWGKACAESEREACAAMFDNRNVWDEEVGERIRARGNT